MKLPWHVYLGIAFVLFGAACLVGLVVKHGISDRLFP